LVHDCSLASSRQRIFSEGTHIEGDVASVLPSLPDAKACWNKHFMPFNGDLGSANARITGDRRQHWRAAQGEQVSMLERQFVQLLGDPQPVGRVVFGWRMARAVGIMVADWTACTPTFPSRAQPSQQLAPPFNHRVS
jgi:hypothetical protein